MADSRYDPAIFASKAADARQVADTARAAFRADIVERGARLGIERDELAAEIHAKREQAQAAEQQAKRELGEAERLDRAADALERKLIKPDPSARGLGEHIRDEELSEQVAEQRALADAARARATAADTRADTLETESIRMRDELVGVERQLAAEPARRKAIEEQLDRLDESATHFADLSRNATRIAEQERIARDAELRGDHAVVDRANQMIRTSRDSIDVGVNRQLPEPDGAVLLQIGVTVPADFTDPPVAQATPIGDDAGVPGSGDALAATVPSAVDPDLIELGDPIGSDTTATDATVATDATGSDATGSDVDIVTGLPTAAATTADDQSMVGPTDRFDTGSSESADVTATTDPDALAFGDFVEPEPTFTDAEAAFVAAEPQPDEPDFSEFIDSSGFSSDAGFDDSGSEAIDSLGPSDSFDDGFG